MSSAESADPARRQPRRESGQGPAAGQPADASASDAPRPRRRRRRGGRRRSRAQLTAVVEDGRSTPADGAVDRAAPARPQPDDAPAAERAAGADRTQGPKPGGQPDRRAPKPKARARQQTPQPESGRSRRSSTQRTARRQRPDNRVRTVRETSAGGLVVSGLESGGALEAALIGRTDRRGRTLWSLPKGHIEVGETAEQTAIREIEEETGLTGSVLAPIGKIDYWFAAEGRRVHKTVHHFLLSWTSGELSADDYEVSEVAWVPLAELPTRLTYSDERKLIAAAQTVIEDIAGDPDALEARAAAAARTEPSDYEKAAAERNRLRNDPQAPRPRRRRGGRRGRGRRRPDAGEGGSS
ncbi:NUDIX domain-containing protein [Tsukamurella sp. 8F]|uniref:NUDIX hydrolase n=1 Tax=unclassified Tsukamurella TaxID=2633480 RepID=UPI0023B9D7EB|nr:MULTISPECIES: NUDIX domain-containing protein [unclassified Tsukamurella]MDF0529422.1 NUDIX domain-containing protein [Tsukamurella sp. 8J]MDF0587071.1 NUDIX domain-containing protein [Tsukamurella sp. 8F]